MEEKIYSELEIIDELVEDEQEKFHRGRGCMGQIFATR